MSTGGFSARFSLENISLDIQQFQSQDTNTPKIAVLFVYFVIFRLFRYLPPLSHREIRIDKQTVILISASKALRARRRRNFFDGVSERGIIENRRPQGTEIEGR